MLIILTMLVKIIYSYDQAKRRELYSMIVGAMMEAFILTKKSY
jgi:hypothetical protein